MDSPDNRMAQVEPGAALHAPQTRQYLLLLARSETFAVPIEQVREVVEYQVITRIPLAPRVVPGVINLRGIVIPVVDLSARLGRAAAGIVRRTCIVVLELAAGGDQPLIGVLVDAVSEAVETDDGALHSCPAGTGIRPSFVSGLLRVTDRFIVVLDMVAVLSVKQLGDLVREARGGCAGEASNALQEVAP